MNIRKFKNQDVTEMRELIAKTMREVNIESYSKEYIEGWIPQLTDEYYLDMVKDSHVYVIEQDGNIVATGGISKPIDQVAWLKLIYVHPDFSGQGLARKIMETIGQDEYYRQANKIYGDAMINALDFYKYFGYRLKNNQYQVNEDGTVTIEKSTEV